MIEEKERIIYTNTEKRLTDAEKSKKKVNVRRENFKEKEVTRKE